MVRLAPLCLLLSLPAFAGAPTAPKATPAPAAAKAKGQRLEVVVTADGFVVGDNKPFKVGQPITLIVTRKVEATCATEIVIKEYGINQNLPLNKPVEVTFTPKKAGPVRFACAMDMIAGQLKVE